MQSEGLVRANLGPWQRSNRLSLSSFSLYVEYCITHTPLIINLKGASCRSFKIIVQLHGLQCEMQQATFKVRHCLLHAFPHNDYSQLK